MRTPILLVAAICAVLACCVCPAWAIQADFSGEYRVEGIYNSNFSLLDSDVGTSDAFLQMRLRLLSVFEVTDKLSLTVRLDGLEKRWGDDDGVKAASTSSSLTPPEDAAGSFPLVKTDTTIEEDDNIDLEWAYMTIKTPVGGFLVGRQRGNVWGTTFTDTEDPRDRITYVLPIQNTIIAAVYEKTRELDGQDITVNDADIDRYYLTGTYKGANFKAGMLYGFYDYATFQDMWQNQQTAFLMNSAAQAGQIYTTTDRPFLVADAWAHVLIPYFEGKFGPFGVKGELSYVHGEIEYDNPYRRSPTNAEITQAVIGAGGNPAAAQALVANGVPNSEGNDTKDGRLLSYNFEASYDLGAFTFQIGYAYSSGDADLNDDELTSFGYLEPGEDWEKLAILTGTSYGLEDSLGGLGNLAGGGKPSWDGYKLYYLGVNYAINERMTAGLLYGKAEADETTQASTTSSISQAAILGNNNSWDEDYGSEYDLTFEWRIFDNLNYNFIAAYLAAGDYWKQGIDAVELDDNYLVWHRLTLFF